MRHSGVPEITGNFIIKEQRTAHQITLKSFHNCLYYGAKCQEGQGLLIKALKAFQMTRNETQFKRSSVSKVDTHTRTRTASVLSKVKIKQLSPCVITPLETR